MKKVANIAKNTSYYTFALILQKVISFTYFTILARNLNPEDLGKYYFAVSFTTIFAIFIDIGLVNVLTREIARLKNTTNDNTKDSNILLSTVLAIKIPLALLSWISVFLLVNLMGYPELTKQLVYLASISMILDSFTTTFFAVMRGMHNLKFESIGVIIFQLIMFGFGLSAIRMGLGLNWVILALVIASVFNFFYSIFVLVIKWRIKLKPNFDKVLIKSILVTAVPFAIFAVLQRFYMYFDTILLTTLAGDKYTGLYQVPFKIVFALQFLPMAFIASLYPAFSNYYKNNKEQLVVTFERAINYLLIISLPISTGVFFLSDKIINIFKSEYTEAIIPLQIIISSLVFIFLLFPIGSLLNATDRQKINTKIMAFGLVLSISLNLILIPMYKTIGASITVLFTNFVMFLLGIYQVPKIINYRAKNNILVFGKVLISCVLMSLFLMYYKDNINILFIIPMGGVIYISSLFMMRGFRKADIISIFNSFLKKA